MCKAQHTGVQQQSFRTCTSLSSIQRVTQDRMADRRHMYPQLVSAAGDRFQLHAGGDKTPFAVMYGRVNNFFIFQHAIARQ